LQQEFSSRYKEGITVEESFEFATQPERPATAPFEIVPDDVTDGWTAMRTALQLTHIGLLVEWVTCLVIGLTLLILPHLGKETFRDPFVAKLLIVLYMLIICAMIFAWPALVIGWILCFKFWRGKFRQFLKLTWLFTFGAVGCGLIGFTLALLQTPQMVQVAPGIIAPSTAAKPIDTTVAIFLSAAEALFTASLIVFACFLYEMRKRYDRPHKSVSPFVYGVLIAGLNAFSGFSMLVLQPIGALSMDYHVLITFGTGVVQFFWLWLLNFQLNRTRVFDRHP
jgi:hypothetical protein